MCSHFATPNSIVRERSLDYCALDPRGVSVMFSVDAIDPKWDALRRIITLRLAHAVAVTAAGGGEVVSRACSTPQPQMNALAQTD